MIFLIVSSGLTFTHSIIHRYKLDENVKTLPIISCPTRRPQDGQM